MKELNSPLYHLLLLITLISSILPTQQKSNTHQIRQTVVLLNLKKKWDNQFVFMKHRLQKDDLYHLWMLIYF